LQEENESFCVLGKNVHIYVRHGEILPTKSVATNGIRLSIIIQWDQVKLNLYHYTVGL